MEHVLLTNLKENMNLWVLKHIPCGSLIESIDVDPGDPTKAIIATKSRENAEKIVKELDGAKVCGNIIGAVLAFEPSQTTSNPEDANGFDGLSPEASARKLLESWDVKIEDPAAVVSVVPVQNLQEYDPFEAVDATSVKSEANSNTESRGTNPDTEHGEDSAGAKDSESNQRKSSSRGRRLCRFCEKSGHRTYSCRELAEYYRVSMSEELRNPPGHSWPEASVVKVQGMYAGPVIQYFEKSHFVGSYLTGEQIRILFAHLLNSMVCKRCGAAGHGPFDDLCSHMTELDGKELNEVRLWNREAFWRRIQGIRRKVSLAKLQKYCLKACEKFEQRTVEKGEDLRTSYAQPQKRTPESDSTGPEEARTRMPNKRFMASIFDVQQAGPKWTLRCEPEDSKSMWNGSSASTVTKSLEQLAAPAPTVQNLFVDPAADEKMMRSLNLPVAFGGNWACK